MRAGAGLLWWNRDTGKRSLLVKRVIFVCVENSNRSQMAETFARIHGARKVEPFSAGSRPSGRVNPKAIEAMKELGYDLTTQRSKSLDDLGGIEFDVAVTMGAAMHALSSERNGVKIGVSPTRRRCLPSNFEKCETSSRRR
jgi:protein-tyrosine-phosphatase